ncbi:MAG TPA: RdgB/HAM1 family non-canonical purine NTP pyrophosphatase [Burkholderiales bacterium]|nr:RdgB/HAM1 family non-canonical purine NTP pyrophosphatase [Burkholderiales bacterium]
MTKTVVLASANAGKLREINRMLTGFDIQVLPQSRFNVPDVDETGTSFIENALLKARHAARHAKLPAIADDSGIEVDYLDGAPGIYSARYAGKGASDEQNLRKLLDALQDVPPAQRGARFRCVMVHVRDEQDPAPIVTQAAWEGSVLTSPRGTNGFGYDPVFFVPTHSCSSAELAPDLKNQLSHRGQALRALVAALGHAYR